VNLNGFKAIGGKMILILNIPTELYNYNEPNEYRLPYNTKEIDYDCEIKMG
jgi:dTDP-4-dehydrorhamnose 3,5-epimerase